MQKFNKSIFFEELFLSSGQYALFYLIVNLSLEKLNFFSNIIFLFLLIFLLIQVYFLTIYHKDIKKRIIISFLTPAILFLTQLINLTDYFLLNTANIFFLIFTILIVLIQYNLFKTKTKLKKFILDFSLTFINILIFIFLYFYIDLVLILKKQLALGLITTTQYFEKLEIHFIFSNLNIFFQDPAHLYIIFSGIILGIAMANNKAKVIELKDKINLLFGQLVDVKIRDKLLKLDENYSEKKNRVILFSDIRNFTSLSEKYTAKEIVQMLNIYFSYWNVIIKEHGGIINKYIGDAIMVIFSDKSKKNISTDAVNASLDMILDLKHVNLELKKNKLPQIKEIGIGIHYGDVIVGNIGDKHRKEFTIIGDNVNIASRLEGLSKVLKTKLVISNSIFENLNNNLKNKFLKEPKKVLLKGKKKKIQVYKLK